MRIEKNTVVRNWHGSVESHPVIVAYPEGPADIKKILTDPTRFPSPVRPVGSNHSVTRCAAVEGGTLINMTAMNRILSITPDRVTAQAGARFIDVAQKIRGTRSSTDDPFSPGRQFFVNAEIGNVTLGAAATAATKDGSFFPDEFGQMGSYLAAVKLITPDGRDLSLDMDNPSDQDELRLLRSSYGLLGIVYETAFKIKQHQMMAIKHDDMKLDEFTGRFDEINQQDGSLVVYLHPYENRVIVEERHYTGEISGTTDDHVFAIRNFIWKWGEPAIGRLSQKKVGIRNFGLDLSLGVLGQLSHLVQRKGSEWLLSSQRTSPTDQIVDFPESEDAELYAFSMWAFDDSDFARIVAEYFSFCQHFKEKHNGYQTSMSHITYRIKQDPNSLLSYSHDSNIWSLDPVSAGNHPMWPTFLREFNSFSSARNGRPLLNQTPHLTPAQAHAAYGDRLVEFAQTRAKRDPENRLLNAYFEEIFEGLT